MPVYWLMFLPICLYMWQMLLPYLFVADGIAIDVSYSGRCYCHHSLLAGVIAIFMCCYDCVADVIATMAGGIAI